MLAFYARGDALVAVPGQPIMRQKRPPGSPPTAYDPSIDLGPVKRVGRRHIPAEVRKNEQGELEILRPASQPATETPWRVDEQSSPFMASKIAQYCRQGALWPADRHTAEYCRVAYVPVEFVDGEWVPKAAPKPAPKKSSGKSFGSDAES